VIFAAQGAVFRQAITADGPQPPRLLRDFNTDQFVARPAPY
jgi:hypothetical protein